MRKRSIQISLQSSLLIAGIVFSCIPGQAQFRCPADTRSDDFATRFVVSGGNIKMPAGAFLLVRKHHELGAIRLISIDPTSTEWLGKSVYESFFQGDGSGSLLGPKVERRTGELNLQPSKGPGRGIYVYKPGPYRASIGKWSFGFDGPSMMEMSDASFWTGEAIMAMSSPLRLPATSRK